MGSERHAECGSPSAAPLLPSLPEQRWHLPTPLQALEASGPEDSPPHGGLEALGLPDELLAVLRRRGFVDAPAITALLEPAAAPDPALHFADLVKAVARLKASCARAEAVAICGDYDADGMTSTALLVGVLQRLGARPVAAIPSRQEDGYGLNAAMVERLEAGGVRLLVTVDNGISACEALERARELGVEVILTDHHSLPAEHPPYLALLHPACTPEGSPYRGLAGVGLAYVLAQALCHELRRADALAVALDLFCIGTVADMAPLLGVNRRWLMDGLPRLGASRLPGLQALARVAGLEEGPMDATSIGFQLAPRINAVGRLGDPRLVVELLTTGEPERALELARECEALNRQRKELCEAIEAEAVALVEADGPQRPAFLLLAQGHWHHGVIGIVAARLVERFGRPVALLSSEGHGRLRSSVRSPKGFAVDQALQQCADLLERFGGHPAAGGFTVRAEQVAALQERLEGLAQSWLIKRGEALPLEPEAHLALGRIDREFWQQLRRLEPFGIGLAAPLFWSSRCRVLEQRLLRGGHLQLTLEQGESRLRAIAWRWQGQGLLPAQVDVAFRLRLDRWQGQERFQLELAGVRCSGAGEVLLQRRERSYWCRRQGKGLLIRNAAGEEVQAAIGAFGETSAEHPYIRALVQEAAVALGLVA